MNNMSDNLNHDDFIAMGFHKVDEKFLSLNPPKIKYGDKYKGWSDERKITYLENLASAMNHAAALVQDERNDALELCDKKEAQLEAMNESVKLNNIMLQSQIEKINAERQGFNESYAKLKKEVEDLKRQVA